MHPPRLVVGYEVFLSGVYWLHWRSGVGNALPEFKKITPPLECQERYVFRYVDISMLRLHLKIYTTSLLCLYLVISLPHPSLNLLSITSILSRELFCLGPKH
jgi:hypothetical protein